MPKHPDCPPRRNPRWAAAVVNRLDEVEGAWMDPKVAHATISAFTGGSGAAAVIAELMRRGLITNPT